MEHTRRESNDYHMRASLYENSVIYRNASRTLQSLRSIENFAGRANCKQNYLGTAEIVESRDWQSFDTQFARIRTIVVSVSVQLEKLFF